MEKKKRGRPVQPAEKKEKIRQNIINVAKKLFADEGYEHISIRKIANQAGCVPRTIYYYFKNKRELLNHLWIDIFTSVSDFCEKEAAGIDEPVGLIKIYYKAYINYWLNNHDHYRVIFMNEDLNANKTHDKLVFEMISANAAVIGIMEEAIQKCIENGTFAKKRKDIIFQMFLLSAHGLSSGLITMREIEWKASEELIATTLDALLSGILEK